MKVGGYNIMNQPAFQGVANQHVYWWMETSPQVVMDVGNINEGGGFHEYGN